MIEDLLDACPKVPKEEVSPLGRTSRSPHHRILHWAPRAYLAVAVLLVPWIVWLSFSLPARATARHYRLAWVGFDCVLVVAFARTGYLALRRRAQTELAAVATATLLLVDAWFDVTTASNKAAVIQAAALAVFGEIPAALFSVYLVRQVNRSILGRLGSAYLDDDGPPVAGRGKEETQGPEADVGGTP